METNSLALVFFHPGFRGSSGKKKEKSITLSSGAGSEVNEVLDKCVRGRKEREGEEKCSSVAVGYLRSGQEKQGAGVSLSRIKFMAIDWNCAPVCVGSDECVFLFGSWQDLTEVKSHHIKPIMAKQANEKTESQKTSQKRGHWLLYL